MASTCLLCGEPLPLSTRNPRLRHDECGRVTHYLNAILRETAAHPLIAKAVIGLLRKAIGEIRE